MYGSYNSWNYFLKLKIYFSLQIPNFPLIIQDGSVISETFLFDKWLPSIFIQVLKTGLFVCFFILPPPRHKEYFLIIIFGQRWGNPCFFQFLNVDVFLLNSLWIHRLPTIIHCRLQVPNGVKIQNSIFLDLMKFDVY